MLLENLEQLGDRTFKELLQDMKEMGAGQLIIKHCDRSGKAVFIALIAKGEAAAAINQFIEKWRAREPDKTSCFSSGIQNGSRAAAKRQS